MNFLIFKDFSELILGFLMLKNDLKISKKGGIYSRGATWMRRGTQRHVAAPRGPTRCLRGADVTYT